MFSFCIAKHHSQTATLAQCAQVAGAGVRDEVNTCGSYELVVKYHNCHNTALLAGLGTPGLWWGVRPCPPRTQSSTWGFASSQAEAETLGKRLALAKAGRRCISGCQSFAASARVRQQTCRPLVLYCACPTTRSCAKNGANMTAVLTLTLAAKLISGIHSGIHNVNYLHLHLQGGLAPGFIQGPVCEPESDSGQT